ncbi:type IVB secretion system protein IcmH/DotU [Variovorax boronicumulans]|uniref:type IVB secretion system protein IcmH/DotU n=1 Tax=Variovorax boronicumulans TaxID=436515 RepID=UPI003391F62A
MPLREEFTRTAHDHFEQLARRLAAAVAAPNPPPRPLLTSPQTLARQSPQPDRLVAVQAARVPLIEAARPLLLALARMPRQLDAAQGNALQGDLADQVGTFQSVCSDARIRHEYITGASYTLCSALDEAAGLSARAKGPADDGHIWADRLLAIRFHGDGKGGENVFRIMATVLKNPAEHIDLLELQLVVIALGFEGMYRMACNGKRVLDEIRHTLFETVRSSRGDAVPAMHWTAIERLLWTPLPPCGLADAAADLFR